MGTKSTALIIGNGKLGSALAVLFKESGIPTSSWDQIAERRTNPSQTLSEAVVDAPYILLSVPVCAWASCITSLKSSLGPSTVCISLAKGFSNEGDTSASFLRRYLKPSQWVIWGGPMLSLELESKSPGTAVLASDDPSASLRVASLLSSTPLTVSTSDDSNGISLAGIAKNCYAIALALAKSSGFGNNAWSSLVVASTNEMAQLLPLFRGSSTTAYGQAGLGDLIATALCPTSVHGSAGTQYARTGRISSCEGVDSIRFLAQVLGTDLYRFPILNQLSQATFGQQPAVTADALWKAVR